MGVLNLVLTFVFLATAPAGSGDLHKLDPLARRTLARLVAGATPEQAAGPMAASPAGELDVFIRGSVSRAELEAAGARVRTELPGLYTAFIPPDRVQAVASLPGVRRIAGSAPAEPELDASVPTTGVTALRGAGPTFTGLNGAGILIGSVDSGVDFGHGDFDDPSGNTRFVRIWDQTVTSGSPPPPTGFAYGTEWTHTQIDANQPTEVDDAGHGTHVLAIAAGDGSQTGNGKPPYTYVGMAPLADLATVKTSFQTADILDGVKYLFDLATARGQSAVVNLSLGSQFGPHDGTDEFEAGLAAMTGPGRIIVKSAGNDRGTARHAQVLAAGAGTDATLQVGGSALGRVVAIDGYYESSENVSVKIRTPNGTIIGPITRGNANATYPGTPTSSGTVYLENGLVTTPTGDYEVYVEIRVESGQNMNGPWTFTFVPVSLGADQGRVDLWRFFNSSNAITADFTLGNDPTEKLISEPGNAEELITVGAWVTKTQWTGCNGVGATFGSSPAVGNLADFSSPGPTRDGRHKPDLAAPGTAIASATSFDLGPTCPGPPTPSSFLPDGLNHVINAGTSMASPHVAGAAALLMQSFGPMTPSQVKNYLFAHALVDAFTGAVWNRDWGNGKLFLDQSSATLLALFQATPVSAGVEIRWELSDPDQFSSVDLERGASQDGPWIKLAAETRYEGSIAVALDMSAELGRTYYYRLEATARSGRTVTFGPLEATAGVPLVDFDLALAAPNPSPGRTRVEFTVPRPANVKLSVLDVQGREVATLAEGVRQPGRYQAIWSGEGNGRMAPPGLYFIRLRTPERSLVRRLVVAR